MQVIHSEIDIEAENAAERVWQELMDFRSYPAWNPFIRKIEGEPRVGERLAVEIHPPGGKGMSFRPRVIKLEPGLELRWLGHLLVPGVLDGEHYFLVERFRTDRVRFFQREIFRGMLVGTARGALEKTRLGFEEMNHALKARVEAG